MRARSPLGNVVTAAGTGSEGNGGSVITNEATLVKTWGIRGEGMSDAELAVAGIDALDARTREVGAHRTHSELEVEPGQIDEIAASIACLSSGFVQITTEDVAAILRASM